MISSFADISPDYSLPNLQTEGHPPSPCFLPGANWDFSRRCHGPEIVEVRRRSGAMGWLPMGRYCVPELLRCPGVGDLAL